MEPVQLDFFQQAVAGLLTAAAVSIVLVRLGGMDGLWATIDLSDNIARATRGVNRIEKGAPSGVYAVAFLLASICAAIGAYHFDLTSTWDATTGVRDAIAPSVGGFAWGIYALALLTYLPTILEMFGAHFARSQVAIFWVQAAVIGLSVFDLFTDRPKVEAFMSRHYGLFVGPENSYWANIAYRALYNIAFGLWWFLASYGLELLAVVFFWIAVGCGLRALHRWFKAEPSASGRDFGKGSRGGSGRGRRPPMDDDDSDVAFA